MLGRAPAIGAGLLVLSLISVGCAGRDAASGTRTAAVDVENDLSTLADLPLEAREGIMAAMRSARPVHDSSVLALHDPTRQVTVTVGESSRLIEGRDGAVVEFGETVLGRVGHVVRLSDAAPSGIGEPVVRSQRRAGPVEVEEWWRNGATGIEQGFTVRSRPDGTGRLHLSQSITSALTAEIVDDGRGVAFADADGERLRFGGLVAFDATGRNLPATMSLSSGVLTFDVDDTAAVFPVVIDPVWSQQAYLKASNSAADDEFGRSVAVSGDTVVVGAPYEDSNATGVNGDESNNSATASGAVYVFTRTGSVWSQQAYLKASNASVGDYFGWSVAVDGDTVVVGAPYEDSNATGVNGTESDNSLSNAGAAYVFTRSGTTWSQQAYLKASNPDSDDYFGADVAVSGDTILVGAAFEDGGTTGVNGSGTDNSAADAGAAYVFERSGSVWSQQAYLKADNTGLTDRFGSAVAVSGDTAAVGAYFEDGSNDAAAGSGAVYVFNRSGSVWSQQAYLKGSNTETGDRFGWSVSISGDTLAAGAPLEDSNASGVNGDESDNSRTNSGAVYVFTRSGTVWSQQAYVKASNTGGLDEFGASVSLSGDALAVGAPVESSNAAGVNGDGSDDSVTDSGAAYAFTRSGTVWSQEAYLKASNTGENDGLGSDIGVSGDTVVAGAFFEDGSSSGVDGADDDAARDTGAAYVWFAAPTYTLTYAATGADSGAAPAAFTGTGLITLDANSGGLAKDGHSFAGWATAAGQSTAISGQYNLGADATLHPVWLANSYLVTFDGNGGSDVAAVSFTHGGSLTFPADPTREGHSFLGWFVSDSGGSALTAPVVAGGNASVTLYAQWAANSYTVTFEGNGGSAPAAVSFSHGGSLTFPTDPSREGFSFLGWFAAESGGSPLTASAVAAGNASVTLYAQWVAVDDPQTDGTATSVSTTDPVGTVPADELPSLPETGSGVEVAVLAAAVLLFLGVMTLSRRRPV
jgi:uncharacterized repeat protein (TIGR02543 family)